MTGVIIDASVIGPLLIPDELPALHPMLLDILAAGRAVVPQHWHLEVGNLGWASLRRRRVDSARLMLNLADLARAPLTIDTGAADRAWRELFALAIEYDLTIYDAAYLELALRRGLPLLSSDGELCAAARAAGVTLA